MALAINFPGNSRKEFELLLKNPSTRILIQELGARTQNLTVKAICSGRVIP